MNWVHLSMIYKGGKATKKVSRIIWMNISGSFRCSYFYNSISPFDQCMTPHCIPVMTNNTFQKMQNVHRHVKKKKKKQEKSSSSYIFPSSNEMDNRWSRSPHQLIQLCHRLIGGGKAAAEATNNGVWQLGGSRHVNSWSLLGSDIIANEPIAVEKM